MPWGRIIKALSGFYYVLPDGQKFSEESLFQCRARGLFRKTGESPLVGDVVKFDIIKDHEGYITEIQERMNYLIRPPIANVSQVVLVFSFDEPRFSSLLLDRFLVHIEKANIPVIICFSKADLHTSTQLSDVIEYYGQIGYDTIITSVRTAQGIEQIKECLQGKVSVFAGQSGVGKSSLLNALFPNKKLKTSEISHRLGRGKHTTRHVELLVLDDDSLVADTPGFSQLDFQNIEPEELSSYFIEMRPYVHQCKYRGCVHAQEPDCAVRKAVEDGKIGQSRYSNYLEFLAELREAKQRRF